jgi:hypothetical protein
MVISMQIWWSLNIETYPIWLTAPSITSNTFLSFRPMKTQYFECLHRIFWAE